MVRNLEEKTQHERIVYDALLKSPGNTATLDQLGQHMSHMVDDLVRRQVVVQVLRYLRAKLNGHGENITKLTGVGRGVKASYRLVRLPLEEQIETQPVQIETQRVPQEVK